MNSLFLNINLFSIFNVFIISIIFNFILTNFFISLTRLKNIQDIHSNNPSRLGGFIIFILFFGYEILYINFFDNLTRFILLVILVPALAEDLHNFIHPYIRLILMLICNFLIVMNMPLLPEFNFGNFDIIFNNKIFQIFFFSIALTAILNGQNMIDGVNGLSGISSISVFICILILGLYVNEPLYVQLTFLIITLIISFLIFNYPFGNIFLGDLGSYFLGLLAGYLIINLFAQHPELPTWLAVIILFYPAFEVLFSYLRKLLTKKSPFFPDNKHLHSIIYQFYLKKNISNKNCNPLVTPTLIGLWLSPLIFLIFLLQYPEFIFIAFFLLISIYFTYYYIFKTLLKN